ncbi:Coenzyme F420 hydrogenase/dehydrogenase, beta subunit C-terminal domain [Candidatus Bathyarchaeota archaeon]|nr:Coenzyme F420 hydrogenase/dehydrogenase, beta subunit C-terminal domain [Candidatus Bathyarchaeota archaeon]
MKSHLRVDGWIEMSARPKVFGQLLAEVINKGLCVGCGGCEAVCPVNSISLTEGSPRLTGICIACGICYSCCPRTSFDEAELERLIFGRGRSENEALLGIYKGYYAGRSRDQGVLRRSQDGGVVSSLLIQFLRGGGDCAVVAGVEEGGVWAPRPMVALRDEEVLKGAGTKYTPSPTLVGVDSAVSEYRRKRVAVVGTPCQIRALRKIEKGTYTDRRIAESVAIKIGLFCMETFDYKKLMEFLEKEGVNPKEVTKFAIRRGKFAAIRDGDTLFEIGLSRVKELVRPCCEVCEDFTAEFSDISVGNVGSPDGWSTVIVRTDLGEQLLRDAEKAGLLELKPLEEGESGLGAVLKLSMSKKKRRG